jgi:glutathione S-transferase
MVEGIQTVKLYYFPGACSLAAHIVLEWTGARYETVKLDRAELKGPEFLALNPSGAVPVLIDGDFKLTQNAAILSYVAEQYPDARLLGDGSVRGRAEVMRWLAVLNSDVHPAFKPIFNPARYHPDAAAAQAVADAARSRVRDQLQMLEARLQGREWLVDARSIADPYLFVMLRWTIKLHIDASGLNNLARFFTRMSADPGVRAAVLAEEGSIDDRVRLPA